MTVSTHRTLLGVEVYTFYNKEVKRRLNEENSFLPEYAIIDGKIKCTDDELDDEIIDKYERLTLFNYVRVNALLDEEINNGGIDSIFDYFDKNEVEKVFMYLDKMDVNESMNIPTTQYIVIDITFRGSYDYYSGGYDVDSEYTLIGWLNERMSLVELDCFEEDEEVRDGSMGMVL